MNAIREARKLNIPVFGIVDTNCDPEDLDYPIPGNDDAVRAIKVVLGVLANAIAEATGKEMIDYITEDDKAKEVEEKSEEIKSEAKPVKEETKEEVKETKKEEKKETKKVEKKETTKTSEKKPAAKKEAKVDLTTKTVAELKEMAKEKGIEGYSKLKKAELIDALK